MKKSISLFIIILSLISNAFADMLTEASKATNENEKTRNTNSFGYVSPGITFLVYIPFPSIGIGYRSHERFGYDISISGSTLILINAITINGSVLCYSKKNFYGGIEASGSLIKVNGGGCCGGNYKGALLNLVLGKEYLNKYNKKRFLQLEIGSPINVFIPVTSFKYGISF